MKRKKVEFRQVDFMDILEGKESSNLIGVKQEPKKDIKTKAVIWVLSEYSNLTSNEMWDGWGNKFEFKGIKDLSDLRSTLVAMEKSNNVFRGEPRVCETTGEQMHPWCLTTPQNERKFNRR